MVNRARRRRKYLDERRKIAQRLRTNENEVEEMKVRLSRPGGNRLVDQWKDTREARAASRVQSLWRMTRAKKKTIRLVGEQKREEAARRIQAFVRRTRLRVRRSPITEVANEQEWPWRPLDADSLMKHEKQVVEKRRQYQESMRRGMNQEELKQHAMARYREFAESTSRSRYDVWLTLLQREQTRQMVQALEGRSWTQPLPYGVCSAALLQQAEEKHRERKASMARDLTTFSGSASVPGSAVDGGGGGASGAPPVVESRAEEEETNTLLRELEEKLGYDFSLMGEGV